MRKKRVRSKDLKPYRQLCVQWEAPDFHFEQRVRRLPQDLKPYGDKAHQRNVMVDLTNQQWH